MRRLQIKFRNTALDVYTNEDGTVKETVYQGEDCQELLFDLGHMYDIQTLALEAIAEQDMEIAQQRKGFNY